MYKSLSLNPHERSNIIYPYAFLHDALSEDECIKAIEIGKKGKPCEGLTVAKEGEIKNNAIRSSNINVINVSEETVWLFNRMSAVINNLNEQFYNFELNGFSYIQFAEYDANQNGHYDWHVDTNFGRPDPENCGFRKLSISILLNQSFSGGELFVCADDQMKAQPVSLSRGSAVVFPSFLPHKVNVVTSGSRYSLVAWIYGPKWV